MSIKLSNVQKQSIINILENKLFYNHVKNYSFKISRIINPQNKEMDVITNTFTKIINNIHSVNIPKKLKGGSYRRRTPEPYVRSITTELQIFGAFLVSGMSMVTDESMGGQLFNLFFLVMMYLLVNQSATVRSQYIGFYDRNRNIVVDNNRFTELNNNNNFRGGAISKVNNKTNIISLSDIKQESILEVFNEKKFNDSIEDVSNKIALVIDPKNDPKLTIKIIVSEFKNSYINKPNKQIGGKKSRRNKKLKGGGLGGKHAARMLGKYISAWLDQQYQRTQLTGQAWFPYNGDGSYQSCIWFVFFLLFVTLAIDRGLREKYQLKPSNPSTNYLPQPLAKYGRNGSLMRRGYGEIVKAVGAVTQATRNLLSRKKKPEVNKPNNRVRKLKSRKQNENPNSIFNKNGKPKGTLL